MLFRGRVIWWMIKNSPVYVGLFVVLFAASWIFQDYPEVAACSLIPAMLVGYVVWQPILAYLTRVLQPNRDPLTIAPFGTTFDWVLFGIVFALLSCSIVVNAFQLNVPLE